MPNSQSASQKPDKIKPVFEGVIVDQCVYVMGDVSKDGRQHTSAMENIIFSPYMSFLPPRKN